MDDRLTVRLEQAQIKALDDLAVSLGKSRSEVLRETVELGLKNWPSGPGPQPQPEPGPQPGPVPPPPGGGGPQPLHPALGGKIAELQAQKKDLVKERGNTSFHYWWPKLAAAMCGFVGFFGPDPMVRARAIRWAFAALALDAVWGGRGYKLRILDRAIKDIDRLIADIPKAWEEGLRTKSPEALAAEILVMIEDRRRRLGETTLADLS